MRANTLITLGASVVCAGLAVFLAKGWIDDAVREHKGDAPVPMSTTFTPQAMPSVSILVAEAEMQFGDELSPETLTLVDFPEGSVPVGALRDYDEVFADGGRVVALTRIGQGEPVLDFKISLPGSRAALAHVITPGMRATTIRVSDAESVAGFVLPGDRVDVLYIRDEEGRSAYGLDMRADVLMQNVRVLGVDQIMDDQIEGAVIAATVTLEVDLADAQKLALAQDVGTLSLSLRAIGEDVITPVRPLARKQLANGPAPQRQTRRTPRPVAPKPAATDPTAQVVVIRGEERDEVNVVSERTSPKDDVLAGGTL
jgi:pilus assembly protein CpaB